MNIIVILKQKSMSDSTINFKLNTSTMKDQLKKSPLRMFKKNLTILEYTSATEQFSAFLIKKKLISFVYLLLVNFK